MTERDKVSVIIPMYNSEQFIRPCVQSASRQSYGNLEILIIDDGSTDHSLEICQELKAADDRIRILCQENRGVSSARNTGLNHAGGEYVFFLDSDDCLHPLLIEEGIRQAKTHDADLVVCHSLRQKSRQLEKRMSDLSVTDERPVWQIVEGEELEEWFHMKNMLTLSRVGGLMSRATIGTLRFDETLPCGEDALFMYHLISRQVRMAYSGQGWYYYRTNQESITHSLSVTGDQSFYRYAQIIRDCEYGKGNLRYAIEWEGTVLFSMKKAFLKMKKAKNKRRSQELKSQALAESKSPLFKMLPLRRRLLLYCCFSFPAVYGVLERLRPLYKTIRKGNQA